MKRLELERESKDINIPKQIYYHIKKKILVINFSLCSSIMWYGCEWNTFQNEGMEVIYAMSDEIISIYHLMSELNLPLEEESEYFVKIMRLYENENKENNEIAIQILSGLSETFLNKRDGTH